MVRASLFLLEAWLIAPSVAGDRPDLPELKLDPAKFLLNCVELDLCLVKCSIQTFNLFRLIQAMHIPFP